MDIELLVISHKQPDWINTGFNEYAKRLPPHCQLKLIEIAAPKRGKNADTARLMQEEGDKMRATLRQGTHVIALDERGKQWSSVEVAQQLQHWLTHYPHVSLLIGGADGLAPNCLQLAQQRWSLSNATLPHGLVRVMVAEQLYRAWSLLNNHPYHRA